MIRAPKVKEVRWNLFKIFDIPAAGFARARNYNSRVSARLFDSID